MDYNEGAPDDYRCSECDKRDHKLWRQYNTFADHIELMCRPCALDDQGKSDAELTGDQIGWLVPAIPSEGGTFWGYSSVPTAGLLWWYRLGGTAAGGKVLPIVERVLKVADCQATAKAYPELHKQADLDAIEGEFARLMEGR